MIVNPILPLWLMIPLVAVVTIFLAWQESKKIHRFKIYRILAVVLMMMALTGLFLKPSYSAKKTADIILLTPEYASEKVDSVLARHPELTLMHLEETIPYKNSKRFFEEDFSERAGEIKIVIGQGLPIYQLSNIEGNVFKFIPAQLPEGITDLFVSDQNVIDRKNIIKGKFYSRHGKSWLHLIGPGGKEDSTAVTNSGSSDFELSFVPKQVGEVLYTLTVRDSTMTYDEILPVHVRPQTPLRVLFLHSYPTFETQYLKNFLARKNNQLILRYQMSKNNFKYEYVNHDQISVDRITPEVLKNIDLIITDEGALASLASSEQAAIQKSIFSGLGLLHLTPVTGKRLSNFFPFQTTSVRSDSANFKIGSKSFSLPADRVRIEQNDSTKAIQKNEVGILSGYTFRGAGKIGFQLLRETFRFALSGDSNAYAEVWSPLLEQVARSTVNTSKIKIITPFPWYENEPIDIEVLSSTESISLADDSVSLPLREDLVFDNIWHARTWAGKSGWHQLETGDGTILSYYVSNPTEWKALSTVNKRNANRFSAQEDVNLKSEKIEAMEKIPPLIFYITFISAAGFIWLAPKL
jgi:hypothetical protein